MIRECVGFAENYIRHYKPDGKTDVSFVIDDILLPGAEGEEQFGGSLEHSGEADLDEKDENETGELGSRGGKAGKGSRGEQIFLVFPFAPRGSGSLDSQIELGLRTDKILITKNPYHDGELDEALRDLVGEYGYSGEELADLEGIFRFPEKHISLISDNNKRITKTMSSSVIYAFELARREPVEDSNVTWLKGTKGNNSAVSGSTLSEFFLQPVEEETGGKKRRAYRMEERLNKFQYVGFEELTSLGLNDIGPEIARWFYSEDALHNGNISKVEKEGNSVHHSKKLSIKAICLVPSGDGAYSKIRVAYFRRKIFNKDPNTKGICMCCAKPDALIASPNQQLSFDSDKRYLAHPTIAKKYNPILICSDCAIRYAAFFGLIKKWKIKVMPLFIDPVLQKKEVLLMDEKGLNKFSHIFNQIGDSDSFDFYLILLSGGELKYFDYVCNYVWEMEWKQFDSAFPATKITRRDFERKICDAIGVDNLDYFESKKEKISASEAYLRNLLAGKTFDFVYRNRNHFTQQDLWRLAVLPIEQLALGSQKDFEIGRVETCLEMWFNRDIIKGGDCMSIQDLRNNVDIGNSPERWAYRAGMAYQFLVSKRASGVSLELENIVRSHRSKRVKGEIVRKFEQRSHALTDEELKQFRLQLAELLAFDQFEDFEFNDLKPLFYAGYIDGIKKTREVSGDDSDE